MDNQLNTVSRATPLRMAQVVLLDDRGAEVWNGSLRQFFRDNRMSGAEAKIIVDQLRPRDHIHEPAFVKMGGGVGVEFMLCLLDSGDDRVRARRRCEHGHWPLTCEQCADVNALDFNYDLQVWTRRGLIQRCGHPESMACGCNGRKFAGMTVEVARLGGAR